MEVLLNRKRENFVHHKHLHYDRDFNVPRYTWKNSSAVEHYQKKDEQDNIGINPSRSWYIEITLGLVSSYDFYSQVVKDR